MLEAPAAGLDVNVWFVGLESVALQVARVQQRVARGGHDTPRADIERRYVRGRLNLIRLLPVLSQLVVYDNSAHVQPGAAASAGPRLLLRYVRGARVEPADVSTTPAWAKPIVAAANCNERPRAKTPET